MYPIFRKENYSVDWKSRHVLKDLLDLPVQLGRDIKHCYQRIHKGYCDTDVAFIEDWFLNIMPDMLQEIKEDTIGYPVELCVREDHDCKKCDRNCRKEWEEILDRMIHLFREAYEPTKENPYEEEIARIYEIFRAKYGAVGEKLNTEEDKKDGCIRWYTPRALPDEFPGYAELDDKYMAEMLKIDEYQKQCKDEALDLFKEWFWGLSD